MARLDEAQRRQEESERKIFESHRRQLQELNHQHQEEIGKAKDDEKRTVKQAEEKFKLLEQQNVDRSGKR